VKKFPCVIPLSFDEMTVLGAEQHLLTEREVAKGGLSPELTRKAVTEYNLDRMCDNCC